MRLEKFMWNEWKIDLRVAMSWAGTANKSKFLRNISLLNSSLIKYESDLFKWAILAKSDGAILLGSKSFCWYCCCDCCKLWWDEDKWWWWWCCGCCGIWNMSIEVPFNKAMSLLLALFNFKRKKNDYEMFKIA